jgi:hypothetical protein
LTAGFVERIVETQFDQIGDLAQIGGETGGAGAQRGIAPRIKQSGHGGILPAEREMVVPP